MRLQKTARPLRSFPTGGDEKGEKLDPGPAPLQFVQIDMPLRCAQNIVVIPCQCVAMQIDETHAHANHTPNFLKYVIAAYACPDDTQAHLRRDWEKALEGLSKARQGGRASSRAKAGFDHDRRKQAGTNQEFVPALQVKAQFQPRLAAPMLKRFSCPR